MRHPAMAAAPPGTRERLRATRGAKGYYSAPRMEFGFTLIELLVVVAIITILAAFLLPALRNARVRAKATVCQSNLKQLSNAAQMYTDDWNGFFPTSYNSSCVSTSVNPPLNIHPYIGITDICGPDWGCDGIWERSILRCPGDLGDVDGTACPWGGGPPCYGRFYSYGIGYETAGGRWHGHITLVDEPVRIIMYADSTTYRLLCRNMPGDGWQYVGSYCPKWDRTCHSTYDRHGGNVVSVGFVDGHASLVPWPDEVQSWADYLAGPPYDATALVTTW